MEFNTYLYFNGDCEAAFRFYEKTLGGTIEALILHEGTPAAEQVPPEWRKKVLHARMTVGGQALMASDTPPGRYSKPQGFSVSINVQDPAEAERVFKAFAEGGNVTMPLAQTFWAKRFGMVVDRFSIPWMVNCEQAAAEAA